MHSWIGLGEAYTNSGRHSAALKCLSRADTLGPGNWYSQYMFGNIQKNVLEYDTACQTFRSILQNHPDDFNVALSFAQILVRWAHRCIRAGEFSKSVCLVMEGVQLAFQLVEKREEVSEAWKLIGDSAFMASLLNTKEMSVICEIICGKLGRIGLASFISEIHGETEANEIDKSVGDGDEKSMSKHKITLLRCSVIAMEKAVGLTEGDRFAHSAAHFNLGISKFRLATETNSELNTSSVRPILQCFKKAIQIEPGNTEYWNAIGIVATCHFPFVAEKAFSRSLQLNERAYLSRFR